jgi:hypothetical protein
MLDEVPWINFELFREITEVGFESELNCGQDMELCMTERMEVFDDGGTSVAELKLGFGFVRQITVLLRNSLKIIHVVGRAFEVDDFGGCPRLGGLTTGTTGNGPNHALCRVDDLGVLHENDL